MPQFLNRNDTIAIYTECNRPDTTVNVQKLWIPTDLLNFISLPLTVFLSLLISGVGQGYEIRTQTTKIKAEQGNVPAGTGKKTGL